jgi:hypothetical protein
MVDSVYRERSSGQADDGFPTYRSYTGSITSGVLLAGELILAETW